MSILLGLTWLSLRFRHPSRWRTTLNGLGLCLLLLALIALLPQPLVIGVGVVVYCAILTQTQGAYTHSRKLDHRSSPLRPTVCADMGIPRSENWYYLGIRGLSRTRLVGLVLGMTLFASILSQGDPAWAQLFDTAESEAQNIFGQYLDAGIIEFLFGLLRIVIWVAAVGFIFFAIYQAQRGEQWQPLLQNAFIVIAAVVVVEGLSSLFFGSS